MNNRKLFTIIWKFTNNNWIVGFALLFIGFWLSKKYEAIFFSFTTIWNAIGKKAIYFEVIISIILFFIISVRVIKYVRNFFKIKFKDERFWFAFAPTGYVLNFIRSYRFKRYDLQETIRKFSVYQNGSYYNIRSRQNIKSDILDGHDNEKRISVIHSIPARAHLSFPDFLDLKCLKQLVNNGVKVQIVIMDVPYSEIDDMNNDMEEKFKRTFTIIRKMFYNVQIHRLSDILNTKNVHENIIIRYFLNNCIPFFANNMERIIGKNRVSNISSFTFPFILKSLEILNKRRFNTYMIVWEKRISKWYDFSDFSKRNLPTLKLSGLIVGKTFIDYKRDKLATAIEEYDDYSFNLTDHIESIAKKILDSDDNVWKIPGTYIDYLACNCIGYDLNKSIIKKTKRRYNKFEMKVNKFYKQYGNQDMKIDFNEAAKRYLLYEEILRLQRKLIPKR